MNLQLNVKMMLKWYIKSSALQMLIFKKKLGEHLMLLCLQENSNIFFKIMLNINTCFVWACLITVDIDWNAFYALDKK